jgi:hypothetical protein
MKTPKSGVPKFKPIPGNNTMEAVGSQFKTIPETNALDDLQKIAVIIKSLQASDMNVDKVFMIVDKPSLGSDLSPTVVQVQSVFSLPSTATKSVTKSLVKRKSVSRSMATKTSGVPKTKPIPGNSTMEMVGSQFKKISEPMLWTDSRESLRSQSLCSSQIHQYLLL